MTTISSPNDLARRLASIRDGVIGLDGYPGVGKSTVARNVSERLSWPCVHLDDFLNKNRGGFLEFLRYDDLSRALARRPVLVEGVCLLEVFERLAIAPTALVYVRSSNWHFSSGRLGKDCSHLGKAETILSDEVERYHRVVRPVARADIVYENSAIPERGAVMNSGQATVDIAFIQAKTRLALALAAGGMLTLIVGLAVLLYGVTGTDETLVKVAGFEVSASGLGGVIMATSAVWALFAYRARPTYAWRREVSEKYDPESRLVERRQHESSTAVNIATKDRE